jgi:hypothetical protein
VERFADLLSVVRPVGRSVFGTARAVVAGRITHPVDCVGATVRFADGSSSLVFRETSLRAGDNKDPAFLAVEFRLAGIGRSRWAHAIFRRTCIVNTPLFAGFPGFRRKLWLADLQTATYRGLYDWDGTEEAAAYAAALRPVLELVSRRDSIHHHILRGVSVATALEHPDLLAGGHRAHDACWWRPTAWSGPRLAMNY